MNDIIRVVEGSSHDVDVTDPEADGWPERWLESAPATDLRVEIKTPQGVVLHLTADELVVDDWSRRLQIRPGCCPVLVALQGGSMMVRTPEGVEVRLEYGWGTLACDGGRVRISTARARLHAVVHEDLHGPTHDVTRDESPDRALGAANPRRLLPAPTAA